MLVVGKTVFIGVDFESAAASAAASVMLCETVSLAACTRDIPLLVVSRLLMAVMPAEGPVRFMFDPGASATGCVLAPVPSIEFPATEKNVGKLDELMLCDAI